MVYTELRVFTVRIHSTNKHCVCVWTNCRALHIKNGSSYNNHVALNSNSFVPVSVGQSRFPWDISGFLGTLPVSWALKNFGPVSRKNYHVLNSYPIFKLATTTSFSTVCNRSKWSHRTRRCNL